MQASPRLRTFFSFLLIFLIARGPFVRIAMATPQTSNPGQGDANRSDPCTHLPDPQGNANGIDKQCPALGSSSGVAKGDFNGDGVADLAVGVPGSTIGGKANVGLVQVIYGSNNGLTTNTSGFPRPQTFSQATLGNLLDLPAPAAGDRFGTALASGDFDGDGYSDLAIGVPGKVIPGSLFGPPASMGAIVVVYGSAGGLNLTRTAEFDFTSAITQNGITLPSLPALESFDFSRAQLGQSLAWGDFNYDGAGDLVAGAPGLSLAYLGVTFSSAVGGIWEILGERTNHLGLGPYLGSNLWTQSSIDASWTDNAEDQFGYSLSAGDFNGDLADDIAIGAPFKAVGAVSGAGMVVVMAGIYPTGLDPRAGHNRLSEGSLAKTGDHFGIALASGDFDSRGKAWLAIGAPSRTVGGVAQAGAVYVVPGPWQFFLADINNSTTQEWDQNRLGNTSETGDQFGTALAANDFNGDGAADLAIGVPFEDVIINGINIVDAGEVDVIYGSPASCSSDGVFCNGGGLTTTAHAPQVWDEVSPVAGNRFGAPLSAWNFGRNEVTCFLNFCVPHPAADLAVGIPYATVNGTSGAGSINVIYGSSVSYGNGLVPNNRQVLTQATLGVTPQAGAHFGAAMY